MKTNFFDYLDFALQFAPAAPEREGDPRQAGAHRHRAGKTFNFKDLSLEHKLEIGLGMKEGESKVDEAVANVGTNINGWRVGSCRRPRPSTMATG